MAVAVVLVAVVYLGVTGEKVPAATNHASGPPIGVIATTTPVPGRAYPGAEEIAAPGTQHPTYFLGAGLTIAGKTTIAVLNPSERNQVSAAFLVPLPVPAGSATLDLRYVDNSAREQNSFAAWSLPLASFGPQNRDSSVLIDDTRQPDASALIDAASQPLNARGFQIKVSSEAGMTDSLLDLIVTQGANPVWPDESYQVTAHTGDLKFTSTMTTIPPGRVVGEFNLGAGLSATSITVDLRSSPAGDPREGHFLVASYDVPLTSGTDSLIAVPVVEDDHPPAAPGAGNSGILANGYHWEMLLGTRGDSVILSYELRVNPTFDPAMFPATASSQ